MHSALSSAGVRDGKERRSSVLLSLRARRHEATKDHRVYARRRGGRSEAGTTRRRGSRLALHLPGSRRARGAAPHGGRATAPAHGVSATVGGQTRATLALQNGATKPRYRRRRVSGSGRCGEGERPLRQQQPRGARGPAIGCGVDFNSACLQLLCSLRPASPSG